MKQYRVEVKGVGIAVIEAESRSEAYKKAFKQFKWIGYHSNFIKFKQDLVSLRVIKD